MLRRVGQHWKITVAALLVTVTAFDYFSGYELSFAVFYLIPVVITAWHARWSVACVVSMVSVACSLLGDVADGARYSSILVVWWNMVILFCFYLSMVTVVLKLKASRQGLEARVKERTAELMEEIAARERLEKALLDVSEKEQRRIGHDLHDSVCQHLTATAMAAQVLSDKLTTKQQQESKDAGRLVELIEDGIDLSRRLARGLAPVELDTEGLATALRELARQIQEQHRLRCAVDIASHAVIHDPQVTTQLFRIAQEAARNAARHGVGDVISISLHDVEGGLEMTVRNDGPRKESSPGGRGGMGLHIMKYRASMIHGTFHASVTEGGFEVKVRVPLEEGRHE
ncbi:MAG: histidine kinase [Luteolibacter sp.]